MRQTYPNIRSPRLLAVFCIALASAQAPAQIIDNLTDPAIAMTVDGRVYPVHAVEMVLSAAKQGKKSTSWAKMLDGVIDNQLLAGEGLRTIGRDKLQAADKVGFAPQVVLEEQFNSLIKQYYFKKIDAYVKARPGGSLDNLVTWRMSADHADLRELTTLRDRGEVRLTPAQRELARKTVIAKVTLPDGSRQDITFEDIYTRTNVQVRVRILQDRDLNYLRNQVNSRVEALFVAWWAQTQSGLKANEIAILKTMLEEKQLKENYMLQLGVVSSIHEDITPFLEKLQKEVTKPEILAWYNKNKEEFRQVEKVKARHIRCASEAACQTAHAAIGKGMEFSAAAKKFSVADDRSANPAGSLGWIQRESKDLPWLHQVALIQQKGQMTTPIRSPDDAKGNAFWEIVRVDDRVDGYSAPDSETVAYQARQEIAKKKAVEYYKALREKLRSQADIRRNGALLKARRTADDDQPDDDLDIGGGGGHDHGHGHGH